MCSFKVITGIALPAGSDKLYSGSKDESVRVWDCQTGQVYTVLGIWLLFVCFY